MHDIKKGDKIILENNSIFECMGFKKVTGIVFLVYPDNHGVGFKCDQTGSMETCDFGDGILTKE